MNYTRLERVVTASAVALILLAEYLRHRWLDHMLPQIMSTALTSVALVAGATVLTRKVFQWMTRQQRELDALFQHSADAIVLVDRQGLITHANPAAEALLGVPSTVLVGRDVLGALCPPPDAAGAPMTCPARQVLSSGQSIPYLDMAVLSTGGRPVPVAASFSLIPGRRGAPAGVAVILRDVSEKRVLEAKVAHLLEVARSERQEAQALYEFSRSLSALPGADRDFTQLAGRVRAVFGADMALVGLLDAPARRGRWVGASDACGQPLAPPVAEMEGKFVDRLLHPGSMAVCAGGAPGELTGLPSLQAMGLQAVLAVPLRLGADPLGAVLVGFRRPMAWEDRHHRQLVSVAAQLAVALENDRLYREIERVAILEERDRLAREMHDGMVQTLTYTHMKVETMLLRLEQAGRPDLEKPLRDVQQALRDAYAEVRRAILNLKHRDTPGLAAYLREYLGEFGRAHGLDIEADLPDADPPVLPAAEVQVIRIVQEALANVYKHARARRVQVACIVQDGWATVTVADDGRGFDTGLPTPDGHFGLKIMRERAERAGGALGIHSAPGAGTRVTVQVPLQQQGGMPVAADPGSDRR